MNILKKKDIMELNIQLLKWQQEVFHDPTRFKVVAAGRRCGKSRLAAWSMIVRALQVEKSTIFYLRKHIYHLR